MMKTMKIKLVFGALAALSLAFLSACTHKDPEQPEEKDTGIFITQAGIHPCLLLKYGEEAKIRDLTASNTTLAAIDKKIISQANGAMKLGPSKYTLSGGRLLDVSRQALMNLFSLAYTYRMTGVEVYLDAAEKELKAVCSFADWHPDHYLDTGEMSLGVAIAYDWLYSKLSESTRSLCEQALSDFALKTGLNSAWNNQWFRTASNWNQVCCCGLVCAALAMREADPDRSQKILDLCSDSIRYVVDDYNPDGTYKEGPMYWCYGTGFNAVLNFALQEAGKSVYSGDGFRKTADYYIHSIGPSGKSFNYCDANSTVDLDVTEFYFASLLKDSGKLWWEYKLAGKDFASHRLLPASLVFLKDFKVSEPEQPASLSFCGDGDTPIYYARTSWDADAAWFGIKGGKAHQSHAHMDQGSFVYDAQGYRWATDLGNVNYERAESGVNLWVFTQNSTRWNILAYQNLYHNTLTLDGALQNVEGKAVITKEIRESGRRGVLLNLTPSYFNVSKVTRQACLLDDGTLEITDRVIPSKDMGFMWTMVLEKGVSATVDSPSSFVLSQGGKTVRVSIKAEGGTPEAAASKWNCKATSSYETTSASCAGFTATIPAGTESVYTVTIK